MQLRILVLIFLLFLTKAEAQSTFEKKFTPSLEQYGRELFETPDNGFFLQGTIEQGWRNCNLIRTDASGDTLWTRTYGTDSIQFYAYDMVKSQDGGYILCGDYQEVLTYPSMDSYIQKIDSLGNQVWFNLFGWPTSLNGNKDHAELVKTIDDGSIIVAGSTRDYYVGLGNYIPVGVGWRDYLAKFDDQGNLLKIKTVSLVLDTLWGQNYQTFDIETIGNKIYWLGINGSSYYPNGGGTTLVAFDSELDSVYTISSGLDDYFGLSKTIDNKLLLFGQGLITKMDTTGSTIWTSPNSSPSFPNEFIEFGGGTFASIGGTYHISPFDGDFYSIFSGNNQFVYLNIYNSSGLLTNSNIYSPAAGINTHLGYNLVHTNDNGFAFVGYSDESIWLVKTDSAGLLNTGMSELLTENERALILPNPATDHCRITSDREIAEITIFNYTGSVMLNDSVYNNSYLVNVEKYLNGVYFIRIKYHTGLNSNLKLVVSH